LHKNQTRVNLVSERCEKLGSVGIQRNSGSNSWTYLKTETKTGWKNVKDLPWDKNLYQ